MECLSLLFSDFPLKNQVNKEVEALTDHRQKIILIRFVILYLEKINLWFRRIFSTYDSLLCKIMVIREHTCGEFKNFINMH